MENSIKIDLKILDATSREAITDGSYVVINTVLTETKYYSRYEIDEILFNRQNEIIRWVNDNTDIDGKCLNFQYGWSKRNKNKLYISIPEKYSHIMPAFKMEFA